MNHCTYRGPRKGTGATRAKVNAAVKKLRHSIPRIRKPSQAATTLKKFTQELGDKTDADTLQDLLYDMFLSDPPTTDEMQQLTLAYDKSQGGEGAAEYACAILLSSGIAAIMYLVENGYKGK